MVNLEPAEKLALRVAMAQVGRGEEPTPNVATVCILTLGRLAGYPLTGLALPFRQGEAK